MPGIEGFELPKNLVVEVDSVEEGQTPRKAKFIAAPLAHGFGNTIGNALRRVLLSSMEGVAVASIKIAYKDDDGILKDIYHEFSSIPNVMEDVTDIILNIKKLKFTCDGELPCTLELIANQAGPVTGHDIHENGFTRVLNKDQLICNLDTDREIRIEMTLDKGMGYRPSEANKKDEQPIGTIPIDCLFSPIERVSYDVQAQRVGSDTDFDRLELTVWADGRLDPREAVQRAAKILTTHMAVFIGDTKDLACENGLDANTPDFDDETLDMIDRLCFPVNKLELSMRAVNVLDVLQIRHLVELVEMTEQELLKHRNCGKKTVQEIKTKLAEKNLVLGASLTEDVKNEVVRRLAAEQIQNKEEETR
ncbi:MAG: DNA-directed RNA polymerase subunit alpha [Lentisphaerae bacterium]|nr:DNA-directed RNA polymerase subunit alpha [Lentisphaerota bacterium]